VNEHDDPQAEQRIEDTGWRNARAELVELDVERLRGQFVDCKMALAVWRDGCREVAEACGALVAQLPIALAGLGVREIETELYAQIARSLRRIAANGKPHTQTPAHDGGPATDPPPAAVSRNGRRRLPSLVKGTRSCRP
jgi:hypothetical protein